MLDIFAEKQVGIPVVSHNFCHIQTTNVIYWTIFTKVSNTKFHKDPSSSFIRIDRRTLSHLMGSLLGCESF
jgi:hypothetical protein